MRPKIEIDEDGLIRVTELPLANRVEVVIDEADDSKVWIYLLDDLGQRIEGGTFDLNSFMDWIMRFYNKNY